HGRGAPEVHRAFRADLQAVRGQHHAGTAAARAQGRRGELIPTFSQETPMLAGFNRCLDRVESFAMIVLMLVATCVAIVQVIARYVFNNSLYWSEETVLYT